MPELSPFQTGRQAVEYVREKTDTVVLSFSGGKDSLACWLVLRPYFPRIIPVYHYWVPGLRFVEEALTYYEDVLGAHIHRLPHPIFYQLLANSYFQPAHRVPICEYYDLPEMSFRDWTDILADEYGALETYWTAVGTRAHDSATRRMAMRRHGTVREAERKFFPVADLKKDELIALFRRHGVRLPRDYAIWGRSFDGIDYYFLRGVRDHYPEDYRRILEWFPLAELEFARKEIADAQKKAQ